MKLGNMLSDSIEDLFIEEEEGEEVVEATFTEDIDWNSDDYIKNDEESNEDDTYIIDEPVVGGENDSSQMNLGFLNRKQRKHLMKMLGIKKPKEAVKKITEKELHKIVKNRRKQRKRLNRK